MSYDIPALCAPATFRKATASDIDDVTAIYDAILTEEEAGRTTTGWRRGIYPVRSTAETALARGSCTVRSAIRKSASFRALSTA